MKSSLVDNIFLLSTVSYVLEIISENHAQLIQFGRTGDNVLIT
jgi:hypothetical protein